MLTLRVNIRELLEVLRFTILLEHRVVVPDDLLGMILSPMVLYLVGCFVVVEPLVDLVSVRLDFGLSLEFADLVYGDELDAVGVLEDVDGVLPLAGGFAGGVLL